MRLNWPSMLSCRQFECFLQINSSCPDTVRWNDCPRTSQSWYTYIVETDGVCIEINQSGTAISWNVRFQMKESFRTVIDQFVGQESGDWELNWILITFLFITIHRRHRAVEPSQRMGDPLGPRTCRRMALQGDCPVPVLHNRIVRIRFHPVSGTDSLLISCNVVQIAVVCICDKRGAQKALWLQSCSCGFVHCYVYHFIPYLLGQWHASCWFGVIYIP